MYHNYSSCSPFMFPDPVRSGRNLSFPTSPATGSIYMNILPQEHSFVQSPIPKPEAKIREPRFACLHAAAFPDFPFFPADTVFGYCRGFMIFSSRKYFLKLQISTFHRACRMLAEHAKHAALVTELSRFPVFLSLSKDCIDLLRSLSLALDADDI